MSDDPTTDETEEAPIDPTELTISELEAELADGDYSDGELNAILRAEETNGARKGAIGIIKPIGELEEVEPEPEPEPEPEADVAEAPATRVNTLTGADKFNCPNCSGLIRPSDSVCGRCGGDVEFRIRVTGGEQ